VPKDEIPSDQYALEFAGYKLKETSNLGPRPEKPIEIYEFEGCPFCRKVREIVSVLDLDVLYYPCPQNGPNFRPKAIQMGGKRQFPYMVDPNTGVSMYESDAIIKYLAEKYGDGKVPLSLSLGLLTTLTAGFAMIGRMGKGSAYTPAKLPPQPLEIWAYEPSPFCKVVRETLVELELPHILHSCARGSPKRQLIIQKTGHFQVPYLEDPNTGIQMFESAEIIDYLRSTYAL
jgi:glutathione S-transferase